MLEQGTKTAVAYIRVSTRSQSADAAHSFHVQKAQIEHFARNHGYKVVEFIYEVASGGNDDRPELNRAVELCQNGHTLISAKVDRLCRSVEKIGALMNEKIDIRFVQFGDMAVTKVVLAIYGAMAEAEKDFIGQRVRESLKMAKERGVVLGNPNIKAVGKLGRASSGRRADAYCLEIYNHISRIIKYSRHDTTDSYIAKCLMAKAIKTSRGNHNWHPRQVRRVIDRAEALKQGDN